MLFVFIGGASASGKTVLAQKLATSLKEAEYPVLNISMDNYYKTADDINAFLKQANKQHMCYDSLEAFDISLLEMHLGQLALNKTVEQPVYSIEISDRIKETVTLNPESTKVVIIEGILALAL